MKSKVWSRAVLLLVAAVWMETKACADTPHYSQVLLNKGDEAVLVAPEAWFGYELNRIKLPAPRFTPKPAPNDYAQHTAEVELEDLRTALRRSGVSRQQIDKIVEAHGGERAKVSRFGTNSPQVVAGLPAEFATYFRGSIACNKGDHATASYEWRELLALPAAERQFKSTWAAYMLGQLSRKAEPDQAIEYFQQVRSLTESGFADSTGLAAASIGWEASAHFTKQRFAKAIELYCEVGDTLSCKWVANEVLANSALHADLAANPLVRRVITARVISREQWSRAQEDRVANWLRVVEKQEVDGAEAEMLALAAYQNDQFETAQRWIKRAPSTFVTQWLQAKLHVRAGKLTPAMAILARLEANPPAEWDEADEAGHETLVDNIFMRSGYYEGIKPAHHITGELGVLHLTRRHYTEALDCFLRGGFWMDAAYVAERVLSVEELKSYVDARWPEAQPDGEAADSAPSGTREGLRYLLARRLARQCLPARAYFPERWRGKYDELMAALKRGETETLAGEERAAGWWEGAKIIREQGLELIGTELEPDWHIRSGNSGEGVTVSDRATNHAGRVLVASADELNRARRHHADPEARFHYRYQAAFIALQAASLLPDNSGQKARILCTAGSWLKAGDAITADIFYKHLVRRCRKTALGQAADVKRWFPQQDVNGDLQVALKAPDESPAPSDLHPEPSSQDTPLPVE